MSEYTRRRIVKLGGATSLGSLAGCLGESPGSSNLGDNSPERRFDPAVHGFGFQNWGTVSDRYPDHDHESVSRDEISRVLRRDWGSYLDQQNWMALSDVPNVLIETIVKQLYVSINQGTATDGHCFGMVHAAAEYFRTPDRLPSPDRPPGSVGSPATEVGDTIDFHHNRQILDPHTWGAWALLYGDFELDYQQQLEAIRNAIDRVGVAGLALTTWPQLEGHAVLSYGYQERPGELILEVYDPNWPADTYRSRTREIRFNTSGERPQLNSPYDQRYSRIVYVGSELQLTALVRTGADVVARYLFGGIVTVLVTSPVSLSVVDSTGTELRRDTADHMSLQPTEYSNIRYRYGAPADEYTIRVAGTAGTQFTLEIDAASQLGKLVDLEITDSFDRTTTTREYRVTVPDSPAESSSIRSRPVRSLPDSL